MQPAAGKSQETVLLGRDQQVGHRRRGGRAAEILEISRPALDRRIRAYGLSNAGLMDIAGLQESHPHDVQMTTEAPNYSPR